MTIAKNNKDIKDPCKKNKKLKKEKIHQMHLLAKTSHQKANMKKSENNKKANNNKNPILLIFPNSISLNSISLGLTFPRLLTSGF